MISMNMGVDVANLLRWIMNMRPGERPPWERRKSHSGLYTKSYMRDRKKRKRLQQIQKASRVANRSR